MKKVRVLFSEDAEEIYQDLIEKSANKEERVLLRSIENKVKIIKTNMHYGDPISKRLIPAQYKLKYGINNLFRVELPLFWRMLYTLRRGTEIEIIAFVLDVIDHKEYNKKFRYKKR